MMKVSVGFVACIAACCFGGCAPGAIEGDETGEDLSSTTQAVEFDDGELGHVECNDDLSILEPHVLQESCSLFSACTLVHEQVHIQDARANPDAVVCVAGTLAGTSYANAAASECRAYGADAACLERGLNACRGNPSACPAGCTAEGIEARIQSRMQLGDHYCSRS